MTGPYKVNGVPLKRVNQTYTIATSTKVDVGNLNVANIDDAFFAKEKAEKASKEEKFFAADAGKKKEPTDVRKNAQKDVDTGILNSLKKDKMLKKYLNARFSLTNSTKPHLLKF